MAGFHYVFAIKWARGFWIHDAGGTGVRKMMQVDAPWIETDVDAAAYGDQLAERYAFGDVPDSTTLDLGDTPTWVQNGDRVNTFDRYGGLEDQRVRTRRVTRFNNGFAKMAPTLGTPVQELVDYRSIQLKAAAAGDGTNASAASFRNPDSGIQSGQMTEPSFETWSWSQVDEVDGQEIEIRDAAILTLVTVTFNIDESTLVVLPDDVTFFVYVNSVLEVFLTVPAGESTWTIMSHLLMLPYQKMMVSINSVGTNTLADLSGVKASLQFTTAPAYLVRESTAETP
jgi:hypothetical protein